MTNEEILNRFGIKFEDKVPTLPIESEYIITAANINEIKDVVNRLVLKANGQKATFSDLFKFVQIVVPESLTANKNYNLLLDFSSTSGFEANTLSSISLSSDSEKFKIFKNNEWESLSNSYVNSNDSGKDLIIDIADNLLPENPTFIRYKFTTSGETTEYRSFAVGTNDFQTYLQDIPYYFITNSQTIKSDVLNSGDKDYIGNAHLMTVKVKNATTEVIPNLSAYILLNGNLTNVTPSTTFTIDDDTQPADGESKLVTITATTTYNGDQYVNKYACVVIKDKLVDSVSNMHYMMTNATAHTISSYQTTRFDTGDAFANSISVTANPGGVAIQDDNKLKYTNSQDGTAFVKVNDRQYPVTLRADLETRISAVVTNTVLSGTTANASTLSTAFSVSSVFRENGKSNITNSNSLNVYELFKESGNELTIDKSTGTITAVVNPKDKYHALLFEYKKNDRVYFDVVNLSTHYEAPPVPVYMTDIELGLGNVNSSTKQFTAKTSAYYDNNTIIGDVNASLTFGSYLSSTNATTLGEKKNSTHYDITEQIKASYLDSEDNRYAVDYKFRKIENEKYPIKLYIGKTSNDKILSPLSTYSLCSYIAYSDGTISSATANTTFTIPYTNGIDSISNKQLTVGNLKAVRPLTIDGSYSNGGITIKGNASFEADWFGLSNIQIIGSNYINYGSYEIYYTSAFYINKNNKKVNANYTSNVLTEDVNLSSANRFSLVDSVSNSATDVQIGLTRENAGSPPDNVPRLLLHDFDLLLSSSYSEDGDEKTAIKNIKVLGGAVSGDAEFKPLNFTFIARDNNGNPVSQTFRNLNKCVRTDNPIVYSEYDYNYQPTTNINPVTSSDIKAIISSHAATHKYDWVEIHRGSTSALIPFDCLSTGYASMNANQNYELKFYDMISSQWCSGNAYTEAREIQKSTYEFNSQPANWHMSLTGSLSGNYRYFYDVRVLTKTDGDSKPASAVTNVFSGTYSAWDNGIRHRNVTIEWRPISFSESAINSSCIFDNREFDAVSQTLYDGYLYNFAIPSSNYYINNAVSNDEVKISGFTDVFLEDKIQVLEIVPLFEKADGTRFKKKMVYMPANDAWIPIERKTNPNAPLDTAKKLVGMKVVYAMSGTMPEWKPPSRTYISLSIGAGEGGTEDFPPYDWNLYLGSNFTPISSEFDNDASPEYDTRELSNLDLLRLVFNENENRWEVWRNDFATEHPTWIKNSSNKYNAEGKYTYYGQLGGAQLTIGDEEEDEEDNPDDHD